MQFEKVMVEAHLALEVPKPNTHDLQLCSCQYTPSVYYPLYVAYNRQQYTPSVYYPLYVAYNRASRSINIPIITLPALIRKIFAEKIEILTVGKVIVSAAADHMNVK